MDARSRGLSEGSILLRSRNVTYFSVFRRHRRRRTVVGRPAHFIVISRDKRPAAIPSVQPENSASLRQFLRALDSASGAGGCRTTMTGDRWRGAGPSLSRKSPRIYSETQIKKKWQVADNPRPRNPGIISGFRHPALRTHRLHICHLGLVSRARGGWAKAGKEATLLQSETALSLSELFETARGEWRRYSFSDGAGDPFRITACSGVSVPVSGKRPNCPSGYADCLRPHLRHALSEERQQSGTISVSPGHTDVNTTSNAYLKLPRATGLVIINHPWRT